MRQREIFYKFPHALQLLSFIAICIGCLLLSSSIATLLALLAGGPDNLSGTASLLFIQGFSTIGGFLIPALWLDRMKKAGNADFLHVRQRVEPISLLCGLAFLILASPVVSALQEWGQSWELSPALEAFFSQRTRQSEAILDQLLHVDSWGTFLMSFLIIAVTAGVCEEFLFRGGLQNLLQEWFAGRHLSSPLKSRRTGSSPNMTERSASPHAAVWIAAIVFSAVHTDIAGFLPRCLLGAILGYAYFYSESIWVPVILHIANNGFSCLIEFCYYKGYSKLDPDLLSQSLGLEWTIVGIAGLAFFSIFIFRYQKLKKETA